MSQIKDVDLWLIFRRSLIQFQMFKFELGLLVKVYELFIQSSFFSENHLPTL